MQHLRRQRPLKDSRRLGIEVWIVLGLSLGQSAVYAVVSLAAKLTSDGGVGGSTVGLNQSVSPRPWLDVTYQLLGIGFGLVPVGLALYLLGPHAPRLRPRFPSDVVWGVALAAGVGLPGLGVYWLGRELGVTAQLQLAPASAHWWTPILLVLAAIQNAVLEEVVVVGYLITRLRQLGWASAAVIASSALLRGSYHLYQGFGQALGNVVMGVVFALWFQRTARVVPLIVAHAIMDTVVFLGYLIVR